MTDIENVIRAYREAAKGTSLSVDPKKANKCAHDLHIQYMALHETPAGRDAIASLMSDEDVNIRLWAARHSLEWAPDAARTVLEQLGRTTGLMGFTAEMTLKEFQKGRLSFGAAAGGPEKKGGNKGNRKK